MLKEGIEKAFSERSNQLWDSQNQYLIDTLRNRSKLKLFLKKLLFWKKIDKFDSYSFPIVKSVSAHTIAMNVVAEQPLSHPISGLYFYSVSHRIELYRTEKIIGKTIEEFLVNLILAWNNIPDYLLFTNDSIAYMSIKTYKHILKSILKQHPHILWEYELNEYELNVLKFSIDYKPIYKFLNKPKPKLFDGAYKYMSLWL